MQSMMEILSFPLVIGALPPATITVQVHVARSQLVRVSHSTTILTASGFVTVTVTSTVVNPSIPPTFSKTTGKEITSIISQVIANPAAVGVFPPWWVS